MIEPVKKLKKIYYVAFGVYLFISTLFPVAISLFIKEVFVSISKNSLELNIVYYCAIILMILCEIYFVYKFIHCCKDLKIVKTLIFSEITGTVIFYSQNTDEMENFLYNFPTIKESGSERTIRLIVDETKLNGLYTFLYLPHTKFAVVKK